MTARFFPARSPIDNRVLYFKLQKKLASEVSQVVDIVKGIHVVR